MVEIKPHAFSELYEISSGISTTTSQAGHGAPFLSFSTVFNHHFVPEVLPDFMEVSESEQRTYSIRKGDVFLTRTSETVDELGMSCVALRDHPQATYSGFLKRLRPKQNGATDAKFMAFYLRSPLFRKTMTNNAVMVLRASLNEQIFSYLDLLLPDIDTQVSIGEFLHLLTSKIDLNNRINAELEALAKTIYDYWFVQFDFPDASGRPYKSSGGAMVWNEILKRETPLGWRALTLDQVINRSGTGLNPRDNFELGKGSNYYVTIKNVTEGRIILDEKCDRIDDEAMKIIDRRSQLRPGDVLFTSIEPVGVTYLLREKPTNWNINESVFTLRPDTTMISSEYLLFVLSSTEMKAFTKNSSAGSIHKGIRHGVLKSFKLPYVDLKLIADFSAIVSPMLQQTHALDTESRELTQLRDWLLPLLMNGQVCVE